MFIFTLRKVLSISFSSFSFLDLASLSRNDGGILNWSGGLLLSAFYYSSVASLAYFSVVCPKVWANHDSKTSLCSSFSTVCLKVWANHYSSLSLCSSFPLLKVIALAFYFGLISVWYGNFPCDSNLLTDVAT